LDFIGFFCVFVTTFTRALHLLYIFGFMPYTVALRIPTILCIVPYWCGLRVATAAAV
jgi:hypothetical protein